ncbi:DNA repair protein rhp57 [Purpureocillium takamizusanense]|uniref:DNA repair protein rhp57 n=1 Tax=Purpureocillium takamizusanense TaxID=2060973 RepID=A0A9Q8QKE5_9HYPO|nr:DNA repair protein rhp57 [Purpureocillium takamizusanense]UNI20197.1 DNA repair protein rhp57 [Purpureocillium takamizusanense]
MTDLLRILPSFRTAPFSALLPAIEQHALTTAELLALHPADIAKQTQLPLLDLKRFVAAIQSSLVDDLVPEQLLVGLDDDDDDDDDGPGHQHAASIADSRGKEEKGEEDDDGREGDVAPKGTQDDPGAVAAEQQQEQRPPPPSPQRQMTPGNIPCEAISTLDDGLDAALGGGVPLGCITEFAGESGAGKTQFLLSLCLAVQLPPPRGLAKQALYISTESGLATRRLAQMLASNPAFLARNDADARPPSLDNILSTVTPDLESQDHILEYQVPVLLSRHDIGLVVVDSVAANYRAEFERQGSRGSNMAARSAELIRLGALLRDLARRHNLAVVVANQVADRFSSSSLSPGTIRGRVHAGAVRNVATTLQSTQDSPLASRSDKGPPPLPLASTPPPPSSSGAAPFSFPDDGPPPAPPALRLDHQQRWFTGWGDDPYSSQALKTPSLGLVWSTQISCRVALFKRPVYGRPRRVAAPLHADDYDDGDDVASREPTLKAWRRWMKVVFAPHVAASGRGMDGAAEFEVNMGGLKSVKPKAKLKAKGIH